MTSFCSSSAKKYRPQRSSPDSSGITALTWHYKSERLVIEALAAVMRTDSGTLCNDEALCLSLLINCLTKIRTNMNERLKKIFKKLNDKYRLILLNDITLEERVSFRLSRLNVYIVLSTLAVILVGLTVALIVFTPLKEYIPGYQDMNMRRNLLSLSYQTDSLSDVVVAQNSFIDGLQRTLKGEVDTVGTDIENGDARIEQNYASIKLKKGGSQEDSLLRKELEEADEYKLFNEDKRQEHELSDLYFLKPIQGIVTDSFDLKKDHFGIDLVAEEGAAVKAVLGGVVIVHEQSMETGHIIGIQHAYNLVSFYKHNSVLLKKVGTLVQAGDAIAIIGSSGELSEGPHLHFELWHNQSPVDPLEFIIY